MSTTSFASIEGEIQTEIFKYTSEKSPTFYFSSRTTFQTDSFLAHIRGYYESGARGTWMFDPNPFRYTTNLNDKGDQLWFGREHPLALNRPNRIDPYTALGHVWVQNQLEALDPVVDGWVGLGIVKNFDSNFKWTATYSPLFLPTFGPSLGINDRGEVNAARFARLPPESVRSGNATAPLRYKIQVGQISEILFQHQAFTGLSFENETTYSDIYFFTAPRPNPLVLKDGEFAVSAPNQSLLANASVKPQFPREYWAGTQYQFKNVMFYPSFEFVTNLQDMTQHYFSVTGYSQLTQRIRAAFGFLSHLGRTFDTPQLSDWLVFARLPIPLSDQMEFRTSLETTLQDLQQSFYWLNQIEYRVNRSLSVLGEIRLLSGQDNSYYGEWRAYDSYSCGVKWLW